ncbi:hypothetical protein, partial [Rhizocola hellebori]|uniref:hypothetical protein n=1 Tax=Rhizocola hellebori TaxID=1392758 RepID=UPI0019449B78
MEQEVAVWVDDGETPLGVGVGCGALAGDVGGDRPEAVEGAGVFIEPGQGFQADEQLDHAAAWAWCDVDLLSL